jgi:PhnB protein
VGSFGDKHENVKKEGADHDMKNIIPTLAVADIDASVRFYAEVLGFDIAFTLPGEDGKLIHASVQRGDSSLMFGRVDSNNPHDQGPLGRGVVLYATVADNEDIDAYFQRVRDAGATVVQEPTDQFWGHRDWGITDPDGYLLFISKETQAVSADAMREAALAGSPAD